MAPRDRAGDPPGRREAVSKGHDQRSLVSAIIDAAKALSTALRTTFGRHAPIQRRQIHEACNLLDRLPKPMHGSVSKALRQASEVDDAYQAERPRVGPPCRKPTRTSGGCNLQTTAAARVPPWLRIRPSTASTTILNSRPRLHSLLNRR